MTCFAPTYRAIASRYPTTGIYDRIASSAEYADIIALEALTNPRVLDEQAAYTAKIRVEDRIFGPGTYPITSSFVYSTAGRFCDGSFGVYYAALSESTAIAESIYHTSLFLRSTNETSTDVDKRIYTATANAEVDDIRTRSMRSKLYHQSNYKTSQIYGRRLYEVNLLDGIVYNSVRDAGGECVVFFRPRVLSDCLVYKYVQLRWDGTRVVAFADLANIRNYE